MMRQELLHVLQHSLGLDQHGQGSQYRNHFVAGGRDIDLCRELVASGHMTERADNGLTGGMPWFSVTPNGIDAVALESPKAPPEPKLTRSQKRYREYLVVGDCFESFADFLRYTTRRNA